GHSIECRICAEDTDNNFLPSTGTVTNYYPSEGHGVRNDSGIRAGMEISMHYDPMIAKLIVHAKSRDEAIAKMTRALTEYKINGVKTTIPFCLFVMNHNDFVQGTYDINFVEKNYRSTTIPLDEKMAVAILTAYRRYARNNKSISFTHGNNNTSKWKLTAFNE
ncbi:MAG: biotin carboxylase, partial [Bacteroidota bacterium]